MKLIFVSQEFLFYSWNSRLWGWTEMCLCVCLCVYAVVHVFTLCTGQFQRLQSISRLPLRPSQPLEASWTLVQPQTSLATTASSTLISFVTSEAALQLARFWKYWFLYNSTSLWLLPLIPLHHFLPKISSGWVNWAKNDRLPPDFISMQKLSPFPLTSAYPNQWILII